MFISSARRRRRRWPFLLAFLLVLLAGGGAAAYLGVVKAPGDVSNPEVDFTEPAQAPPERPREQRGDDRLSWTTYGLTPQRTRWLRERIDPPYRRVWTFGGSKLIEFPPVLAKGRLFFVKNNGEAYAISARTGKTKWRRRIGFKAAASPAYYRGKVFFSILEKSAGSAGRMVAMDADDGSIEWAKDLPSRTESSPLAMEGRLYFGSENGTVYALRARDGKEIWSYRAAGAVKAALAYSSGKLYFGDYAGQVTALRRRDGAKVWSASTQGRALGRSGNFYSTPAVAFGRVYVGNTDSRVYSFSARTGELAWSRSTGGFVYSAPAVANAPGTKPAVYIGSYDGNLYSLDARSGDTIWSHQAGGRISGAPTVVGDVVYFSNLAAHSTTGLDVKTGKPVWTLGRGAFTPVISDGERLYVTGYSSVYAFEQKPERKERRRGSRR